MNAFPDPAHFPALYGPDGAGPAPVKDEKYWKARYEDLTALVLGHLNRPTTPLTRIDDLAVAVRLHYKAS